MLTKQIAVKSIFVPDRNLDPTGPVILRLRRGMGRRYFLISGAATLKKSAELGQRTVRAEVK